MKTAVILFSVLTIAVAGRLPRHILYGKCYDFVTDGTLDLQAWANGKWFEIKRYDNEFEKDTNCSSQIYFFDSVSAGFDVSYSTRQSDGTTSMLQGRVNVMSTGTDLSMTAKYPHDSSLSSFDILATDTNSYSVIYSCWQVSNGSLPEKQERLWVLSRTQTLSNETLELINSKLVVDNKDIGMYLYDVPQEGC